MRVVKSSCVRQSGMIGRPRKPFAQAFISPATLLRRGHEDVGALERQPQVALVVERHAVDLAERVLAVEHPAVGAGEEGVGDVADALAPCARAGASAGPVPWIHWRCRSSGIVAAVEPAGPRVAHGDVRPADRRVVGEEADALVIAPPPRAPVDARLHEVATPRVEGSQRGDRLQRAGGEHVAVVVEDARAKP